MPGYVKLSNIMNNAPILISACLCGVICRYDGNGYRVEALAGLYEQGQALAICPEVEGGLETPRPPCEIIGERVLDREGRDVTENFRLGAQKTLELARRHGVQLAILKERSPSCGSRVIYDGTFTGRRISGQGIAAALLGGAGIQVCSEQDYLDFLKIQDALE